MKKSLVIFALIVTISILSFWPVIFWYKDLSFDKVQFVNEWIKLFGSGIIIALIFYFITLIHSHVNEQKTDSEVIQEIIASLNSVILIIINKDHIKYNAARESIRTLSYMHILINNKKKKLKTKLLFESSDFCEVEARLANIYSDADNSYLIGKISYVIDSIKKI
jgi:hypothetical protein